MMDGALQPSEIRLGERLQDMLWRMLMRPAVVSACEPVGDHFRLLTLSGAALRGVGWKPGQKLQVAMGTGFLSTRTYTPIDWDEAGGHARILAFVRGETPGSAWAQDARVGDHYDVFGPRASVDLSWARGPLRIFGDETSIGLASALQSSAPGRSVICRFEAAQPDAAALACDHLGLHDAKIFARMVDETHLDLIEAELPALAVGGATFVLSGRAQAIQRFRQALKRLSVPGPRIVAKAYWAPGKVGLD